MSRPEKVNLKVNGQPLSNVDSVVFRIVADCSMDGTNNWSMYLAIDRSAVITDADFLFEENQSYANGKGQVVKKGLEIELFDGTDQPCGTVSCESEFDGYSNHSSWWRLSSGLTSMDHNGAKQLVIPYNVDDTNGQQSSLTLQAYNNGSLPNGFRYSFSNLPAQSGPATVNDQNGDLVVYKSTSGRRTGKVDLTITAPVKDDKLKLLHVMSHFFSRKWNLKPNASSNWTNLNVIQSNGVDYVENNFTKLLLHQYELSITNADDGSGSVSEVLNLSAYKDSSLLHNGTKVNELIGT